MFIQKEQNEPDRLPDILVAHFILLISSSYGSTSQFGPWPPLMVFRNNKLFTWLDS
jgi:hypothetical protein